jgi:Ser/Thr protein kinase RdoA (MazF antagonist)
MVLLELQRKCLEIGVPNLQSSVSGQTVEVVELNEDRHCVRLFSYVHGAPIANRELSPRLLADIGRSLALVDDALRNFKMTGLNEDLIFNVERLDRLRPLSIFVERDDERTAVEDLLTHLEVEVIGKLRRLRRQVIHNDLNGTNILTLPSAPDKVAGIIDFGDIIDGALIVDLSVAIARQVGPKAPVECAIEMLAGYNQVTQLSDDEVAMLFDLICARLVMRGLIWSWRKAEEHPRYHAGRIGNSLAMLMHWKRLGRNFVTDRFLGVIHQQGMHRIAAKE